MALRLPAGTHRVRLGYVPPGFATGAAISAATAALLLALALVRLRRRG
jgi:uncharacterized membrane protein YfhO